MLLHIVNLYRRRDYFNTGGYMNKITQQLSLDLVEISHNVINARQNDRLTRDINMTITNNGQEYELPETAFVYLRGRRTDGKPIFYNVEITDRKKGLLHAELHNYVLCCPGRCRLDVGVYKRVQDENEIQKNNKTPNEEEEIASTDSFILYIPEEVFDEVDVVESDEGSTLAQLINSARDEIDEMNTLEETVSKNEKQRTTNESVRKTNEENRQRQENLRQEDTKNAIRNANAAIQSANLAADNANSAAESANNAAANANTKATDLQNKLDSHHFILTEDKDIAGGVPGLDANIKIPNDKLYQATTTSKGITQLTDSVTSTSISTAATANSVKTAYDKAASVDGKLQTHNSSNTCHDDIRELISALTTRLNALADSDDTTLDQLSEIVTYIKNNKNLIDGITTSKVNVSDIIDNLVSTAVNKPLSAKQGKMLKDLIDGKTSIEHTHSYLPLSGGVITKTYTNYGDHHLQVRNNSYPNAGVDLFVDIEGGNIELKTNDSSIKYQIDTLDNKLRLYKLAGSAVLPLFETDNNNLFNINGNAQTTNKLKTARIIFGRSFDGSANITGNAQFFGGTGQLGNDAVDYSKTAVEIREAHLAGAGTGYYSEAPTLSFHWANRVAATIALFPDGSFNFKKQDGKSKATIVANLSNSTISNTSFSGSLLFPNNSWINIGDDIVIGDRNHAGALALKGISGETSLLFMKKGDESITGSLQFNGTEFKFSDHNIYAKNLRLKPSGANYGSKLNFGDGEYVYLHEDTDDHLSIYARAGISFSNKVSFSNDITTTGGITTRDITINGWVYSDLIPALVEPATSNNIGSSDRRWRQIWCYNSINSASDKNLKKNISGLSSDNRYMKFFMLLQPKSYLFKDGESGRTHVGFISQDVEEAMSICGLSSLEFAGFCKDQKTERIENEEGNMEEKPVFDGEGNPVYLYSLRYEEFIALNTMMIQKLCEKNENLENRLTILEEKMLNL